jgi:ATP-dependent Clp protease ATP-binding subunit ClpA
MQNLVLSEEVKKAIHIAQSLAKEFSNATFSPAHVLRGALNKELPLRSFLEKGGKDFYFMEDWADVRIESYPKGKPSDNPEGDEKVKAVFEEAENLRIKMSKDEIDLICFLGAISTPGIAFSYDQLKTFPVTVAEIVSETIEKSAINQVIGTSGSQSGGNKVKTDVLTKYCIDKTALAREGKLDPVVGRDKETRMIAEILGRRSKPNVIIIGEPGVGKTALVNGFVFNILNGKVPESLRNALVFELDSGAFIAGATYKGEAEDRIKNIIQAIEQFDKAILFIDNIHTLFDKNGATPGLANVFKPELSKGKITVIGTTTSDQFRKHIESDESLNRFFETVKVEEPDEKSAERMLKVVVPTYENHHKIALAEDVIGESIRLARRYLKERSLPDSAIDLIDRTMSAIKMMADTTKDELLSVEEELKTILDRRDSMDADQLLAELRWVYNSMRNKISGVLFGQLESEADVNKIESPEETINKLNELLAKLKELSSAEKNRIEKTDVAAVVSHKTGIPLGKLQSQEKERLLNMEEILRKRVVGQDHAIKAICEAILESRSGLNKPGQPIGSFFFLGPTGTGKTELAKSLAEFLFNDESAMIRFDMSEFKEEHSAALLYGAPPGYVGYEEGGMLVNKIRQKPYAVVLFDEIEKAHPSVFDLFLQIMDEGKLHDRLGKEGDFSNSVVLFTSNIGSDFIVDSFGKGNIPKSGDLMEIMTRHFRPEFLARLTEIIPFSPITEKIILNIFNIQLKGLLKLLDQQGISLEIDPQAREHLAMLGFTPKYGARPLSGVIRNQLRRPLSRMIISGQIGRGDKAVLSLDDTKELKWDFQKEVLA